MNFERGKDPKEVMEVGAAKVAIKVYGITYVRENIQYDVKYPNAQKAFLKRLQNLDFDNDPLFGMQDIKLDTKKGNRLPQLAGKMVKCYGEYFSIPTKEELIEAGFEHLYSNASFEKGVEDAERMKMEAEIAEKKAQSAKMVKMMEAMASSYSVGYKDEDEK